MLEPILFCAGFALIFIGGVSLIYPLRWLRIRTRGAALLVVAGGFLLLAIGAQMLDSYVVYLGFMLFLAGVISLIRPLRFICIQNRRWAFAVAGIGLLVFSGSVVPTLWQQGSGIAQHKTR